MARTKAKARTRSAARSSARAPAPRSRKATPARARPQRPGALAGHKHDIEGLALIVVAVLLGLGVWAHDGGVAGEFAELALRGLFGYGAYTVPLLVALVGVAVLRRPPANPQEPVGTRVAIGLAAMLLGLLGLAHLWQGAPPPSAAPDALQRSGGLVGAAVTAPLARWLSPWGAGTVFAVMLFLGALITTRTSVASVGRALRSGVRYLFSGPPEAPGAGATAASAAPAPSPTRPRPGRSRRRPAPLPEEEPGLPAAEEPEAAGEPAATERPTVQARPPLPPPVPAEAPDAGKATQLAMDLQARAGGSYTLPPPSLLRSSQSRPVDARKLDETAEVLERTLHQFEVDARVARYTRGPTVTRYEVELGPATKVARVIGLSHDIAYALASPDVRIIAPIPGKSAIGIEVPNRDRELVTLGDVLKAAETDDHPLTVALGKDIGGEPVLANLADMPHVLIAGATGAGKSVCLNVLVTSLLMRATPEQVRLILIDPKRVEMTNYDGVPHLITPVVTHPKRASEALNWAVREMEVRLETLAAAGVRNIAAYNQAAAEGKLPPLPPATRGDGGDGEESRPPLPYIVVVIDELADLMMVAPREVEDAICRIAQMARAVGIHLVVATQRPSVDVVTGLIKANIPSRIAFMVASTQDSRVILDSGGAEKLVGHGDMLYLPGGTSKPRRVQGAFITEKEVEAVVAYCKAQRQASYQPGVVSERGAAQSEDSDEDPLLSQAMEIVVRSGLGSTSMLQSKLKVGFSRARRIMDQLEERGVVGPSEGSKPRDVLMTVEELEELLQRESTYGELAGDA